MNISFDIKISCPDPDVFKLHRKRYSTVDISDGRGIPVPQPEDWSKEFDCELEAIVVFPDGSWTPIQKDPPERGVKVDVVIVPDGFTVTGDGHIWRNWKKAACSATSLAVARAFRTAR